jgi:YHS domain-containing protein
METARTNGKHEKWKIQQIGHFSYLQEPGEMARLETLNQRVQGSSPCAPTKFPKARMGRMRASLCCAAVGIAILAVSGDAAYATEAEFGGECVMGLALGKDIKTDCSVNTVYNGKIYCFGNATARELFLKNPDEFLLKAQVYYSSKQQ